MRAIHLASIPLLMLSALPDYGTAVVERRAS